MSVRIFEVVVLVWVLALAPEVRAQVLEEYSHLGVSENSSRAEARQEILDQAVAEASFKAMGQILGEDRLEKNRQLLEERIVPNSSRYVMLVRPGAMTSTPSGFQMPVQMQISRANLEALLLEQGLLYQIDGPPTLLPMLAVVDRVSGQSFHWWVQAEENSSSSLSQQLFRAYQSQLKAQLQGIGFLLLDPLAGRFAESTPAAFRALESPPTEDYIFMSRYHNSQLVLRGQIGVRAVRQRSETYRVDFRLAALHANNGRVVAEVVRSFESEPGNFPQVVTSSFADMARRANQDLVSQIHDSWRSGTFGANLVKLSFRGSLTPPQINDLKRSFLSEIRDLKTMRERMFEPGQISFESDTSLSAEQLAAVIRQQAFRGFHLDILEVAAQGIVLSVQPR